MDEIVIRKVSAEEINIIVSLANEIWPETYRDILSPAQITYMLQMMYAPDTLRDQLMNQQHQFLVAALSSKPVAFASYGPTREPGVFKLHKLYVQQQVQGKGIGKLLIDYILSEIRQLSGIALELNVNRNNTAKRFYEKIGFVVVREEDIDIGNGYFMNDYVMRRVID